MPQYTRRDRSPRFPGFADLIEFLRSGARLQSLDVPRRNRQREVSGGPNVGPPKHHQQINVRRPAADSLDLEKLRPDRVVIDLSQSIQVEPAFDQRAREFASVRSLLPAEAGGF